MPSLAVGSFTKSMQALQQLVAVHIGLALALQQIRPSEVVLELLHSAAGQKFECADVGDVLILEYIKQLLHLACSQQGESVYTLCDLDDQSG